MPKIGMCKIPSQTGLIVVSIHARKSSIIAARPIMPAITLTAPRTTQIGCYIRKHGIPKTNLASSAQFPTYPGWIQFGFGVR